MAEATGLHALYASPAALDKGGAVGSLSAMLSEPR